MVSARVDSRESEGGYRGGAGRDITEKVEASLFYVRQVDRKAEQGAVDLVRTIRG